MKIIALSLAILTQLTLASTTNAAPVPNAELSDVSIRTAQFARPPYSAATYYIYEQDGTVICTKLKVCNKFDDCEVTHNVGSFVAEEDLDRQPFDTEEPVLIAKKTLRKHLCLTKHNLVK